MFGNLPSMQTYYQAAHHYSPALPSPLSSSPLRNSPSPLSPRNANVPSSPSPMANERDTDIDTVMSSPSKPPMVEYDNQRASSNATSKPHPSTQWQSQRGRTTTPTGQSSTITPPSSSSFGRGRPSAFSQRAIKSNPLLSSRNSGLEGRETRRKLFLKRVRDVADEKRFKSRGILGDEEEEEIMRLVWLQEERSKLERWQRDAHALGLGALEPAVVENDGEAREDPEFMNQMLAEEMLRAEERELEAYLAGIEGDVAHIGADMQLQAESMYGSDEDDYDDVFMDFIEEEQKTSSQQQEEGRQRQSSLAYVDAEEMMDMS